MTNQVGHVIDFMPTCLDLAGASYPETYDGHEITPLEGKSLAPIFRGEQRQGHDALYWEHEGNRAIRQGKWKMVSDHPGGWKLYDMEADRTELHNLSNQHRGIASELRSGYKVWSRKVGVKPWPYATVAL
jgi:arylsulfatase